MINVVTCEFLVRGFGRFCLLAFFLVLCEQGYKDSTFFNVSRHNCLTIHNLAFKSRYNVQKTGKDKALECVLSVLRGFIADKWLSWTEKNITVQFIG